LTKYECTQFQSKIKHRDTKLNGYVYWLKFVWNPLLIQTGPGVVLTNDPDGTANQ